MKHLQQINAPPAPTPAADAPAPAPEIKGVSAPQNTPKSMWSARWTLGFTSTTDVCVHRTTGACANLVDGCVYRGKSAGGSIRTNVDGCSAWVLPP